jgi:hypothetical protein
VKYKLRYFSLAADFFCLPGFVSFVVLLRLMRLHCRTKSTEGGVVMSLIAAVSSGVSRGSPALGQAQGQTSGSLKGSGGSDPDFSR